jgi:hypothetical protein
VVDIWLWLIWSILGKNIMIGVNALWISIATWSKLRTRNFWWERRRSERLICTRKYWGNCVNDSLIIGKKTHLTWFLIYKTASLNKFLIFIIKLPNTLKPKNLDRKTLQITTANFNNSVNFLMCHHADMTCCFLVNLPWFQDSDAEMACCEVLVWCKFFNL